MFKLIHKCNYAGENAGQIGTQNAIQNTTHDQDLGFGSKNPKTSKNIKNMYVEPCRQNYMNFGNSVI